MSNYVCYHSEVSVTNNFSGGFFYLPTKQKTSAEWGISGHKADNSGQFLKCKKINVQSTIRDKIL